MKFSKQRELIYKQRNQVLDGEDLHESIVKMMEELVTTVAGLIVGIVSIFAYNYLVSKVDKVQNAMEADIISFLEIVAETKEADAPAVQPVAHVAVKPRVEAAVVEEQDSSVIFNSPEI